MQIIWFKQSRKSQIGDEHGAIIEKPFLACPKPNSPHPHPTRWQLVGYFLICSHARLEAFTVRHIDNFVPLFTNFLALFKDVSLICWISQQRLFLRHVEPDKKMPYLLKRSLETHMQSVLCHHKTEKYFQTLFVLVFYSCIADLPATLLFGPSFLRLFILHHQLTVVYSF